MINLCTLFDSNYLDKGIALYNSLERYSKDFCLYVLCFDYKCFDILTDLKKKKLIPVKLEDFETEELLNIKKTRGRAEYCWTCTAASIEYMIKTFNLDSCTYLDGDLYFYCGIERLFKEIEDSKCDIAIMEHRYNRNQNGEVEPRNSGKYCVEFNYFKNNENGMNALRWWKEECFKWCFSRFEPAGDYPIDRYGDQKYLEQFERMFDNVHVIQDMGAGVAPWNTKQYSVSSETDQRLILHHSYSNTNVELCFYHFQNLKYISKNVVNIKSQTKDKVLKRAIYIPYLRELEAIRSELMNRYDLDFDVRKSYSTNKIIAFIQRNLMQFKLMSFSDLIFLNEVRN